MTYLKVLSVRICVTNRKYVNLTLIFSKSMQDKRINNALSPQISLTALLYCLGIIFEKMVGY